MQLLQPMQRSRSKSTMPSARVNSARVGQIVTHGASVQWLQRSTPKLRVLSGKVPWSTYLTQVRNWPTGTSCSVLQATVQAWQPMHVRWSIAKPYLIAVLPDGCRRAAARGDLAPGGGAPGDPCPAV